MSEATGPGRLCPATYRYSPRALAREPELTAETLYVVGGLYGNVEALDALLELAGQEKGGAVIAFNGDFHWFDIVPADYERVATAALNPNGAFAAIRGNVETELAGEDDAAGCGCAYPAEVSDAEVSRSNEILAMLRETARAFPELRARQGALPMHLTAQVGEARIGIVHGDAAALSGWGFAHDQLDNTKNRRWLESAFVEARVDVFASSHTCLPALREFPFGVVINNGAAGMPNLSDTAFGIVTRLSTRPAPVDTLYGTRARGIHVDALALHYDAARWMGRFLAAWPEGSPARASYFRRIARGPHFSLAQAAPAWREPRSA